MLLRFTFFFEAKSDVNRKLRMYAVFPSSLAAFTFAVTKLRLFGLVRVTKIGSHPPLEKPIQWWHLSLMLPKSKTSYCLDESTVIFLQILDSEPFSLLPSTYRIALPASLYIRRDIRRGKCTSGFWSKDIGSLGLFQIAIG